MKIILRKFLSISYPFFKRKMIKFLADGNILLQWLPVRLKLKFSFTFWNLNEITFSGSSFFLSLGLAALSIKSTVFCFRTITKHTPLYTQPVTVIGPLRWLASLAYALILIVIIEMIFTAIVSLNFSVKLNWELNYINNLLKITIWNLI